uniref:Ankyrin repeat and EF-hand domain-containing protein 1 isoform X1 n=1 Tax=Petromyzon marinus TaxID=7757 RepID=A0AAJ7TLC8_PETMA|nr:ankyrin repeat and EF-hand domain-containing protein 1 isoform X1 [Petromyzon marinus]
MVSVATRRVSPRLPVSASPSVRVSPCPCVCLPVSVSPRVRVSPCPRVSECGYVIATWHGLIEELAKTMWHPGEGGPGGAEQGGVGGPERGTVGGPGGAERGAVGGCEPPGGWDVGARRLLTLHAYKLLQLIRAQDEAQVRKLCRLGSPGLVNTAEPETGQCGLHVAAAMNLHAMCTMLLALGARPDVQDHQGWSPVMVAAALGHESVVEVLAAAKANMALLDRDGRGVLFHCLQPSQRHERCMRLVLRGNADVNVVSRPGTHALFLAAQLSAISPNMSLQLLEHGANANASDSATGRSALMEAAAVGAVEVVRVILRCGGDVNARDKQGSHSAHRAALNGHFQVLQVLAAMGADLGLVALDGSTALHLAALKGHTVCCRFLAQRGCNPKLKNAERQTARMLAKESGHKATVKALRKEERLFSRSQRPPADGKKGVCSQPWAVRLYDWTQEYKEDLRAELGAVCGPDGSLASEQLLDALRRQRAPPLGPPETQLLLQAHDLNKSGTVVLEEFLKGNKYLAKSYLMSAFEPKGRKGKKGRRKGKAKKFTVPLPICVVPEGVTPRRADGGPPLHAIEQLSLTTDCGRFDRDHRPAHPIEDDSAWYMAAPERTFVGVTAAVRGGDCESLLRAFSQDVPVDVRDPFYKTPLMAAAAHGNMELAAHLLQLGADVQARDAYRWTALHHACHAGQADIAALLLDAGAEANAMTLGGSTALMRAAESGRLDCVTLLLERGARLAQRNKQDNTALEVAQAFGEPRITAVLQARFDALPRAKESRGGNRKKGDLQAASARASSRPHTSPTEASSQPARDQRLADKVGTVEETEGVARVQRAQRSSMLHEATRFARRANQINVTFTPRTDWRSQASTPALLHQKESLRQRFSEDIDFPGFQMPFQKGVTQRAALFGALDSRD